MTYPTITDLKAWLGITGATEDANLTVINDGVIESVEAHTGRVFVAASATRSFPVIDRYVKQNQRVLVLAGEITALTTLTNGDGVAYVVGDFDLLPVEYSFFTHIRLRSSVNQFSDNGDGSLIQVVADWGYSTACPADLKLAMIEHGALQYRVKTSGGSGQVATTSRQRGLVFEAGELPSRIMDVYERYKR